MEGTTATHSADPITSSGIPVSGADWISRSTVAAALTRSAALLSSSSVAAIAEPATPSTTSNTKSFFIGSLPSGADSDFSGSKHLIVGNYSVERRRFGGLGRRTVDDSDTWAAIKIGVSNSGPAATSNPVSQVLW